MPITSVGPQLLTGRPLFPGATRELVLAGVVELLGPPPLRRRDLATLPRPVSLCVCVYMHNH